MPDRRDNWWEKRKTFTISNKLLYVLENNVCYFLGVSQNWFVVHRHLENNLFIPNIDFISTIVKVAGIWKGNQRNKKYSITIESYGRKKDLFTVEKQKISSCIHLCYCKKGGVAHMIYVCHRYRSVAKWF